MTRQCLNLRIVLLHLFVEVFSTACSFSFQSKASKKSACNNILEIRVKKMITICKETLVSALQEKKGSIPFGFDLG